jgi:hypothetical protein
MRGERVGAPGAYQAGVYEALVEASIHLDWIAAVKVISATGLNTFAILPMFSVPRIKMSRWCLRSVPHTNFYCSFAFVLAQSLPIAVKRAESVAAGRAATGVQPVNL